MTFAMSSLNSSFPCHNDRMICILPRPKNGSKPVVCSLATHTPQLGGSNVLSVNSRQSPQLIHCNIFFSNLLRCLNFSLEFVSAIIFSSLVGFILHLVL